MVLAFKRDYLGVSMEKKGGVSSATTPATSNLHTTKGIKIELLTTSVVLAWNTKTAVCTKVIEC